MDTELRIGEVAKRSDVSIDTPRYYERLRLLARTRRSSGGFRLFTAEHVVRVQFIKQAQDLSHTALDWLLRCRDMQPRRWCHKLSYRTPSA